MTNKDTEFKAQLEHAIGQLRGAAQVTTSTKVTEFLENLADWLKVEVDMYFEKDTDNGK